MTNTKAMYDNNFDKMFDQAVEELELENEIEEIKGQMWEIECRYDRLPPHAEAELDKLRNRLYALYAKKNQGV